MAHRDPSRSAESVAGMLLHAAKVALVHLYPVALLLAAWEASVAVGLVKKTLLPAPSAVFARLFELLQTEAFLEHIAQTLVRLFAGLGIATALGLAIGLAAANSRIGGRMLEPLVRILAPIPKIALVAADAVFPILFATYHGARMGERKLLWSARAAGTSPGACVYKIVLPAALPSILTGFRIALVISCVVVFLAEMISSTDGLGHLLIRAARSFRTVDMFVPLVTISLLGLLLNALVAAGRRRLLAGYGEAQ
jgi:ABC-type nitrate/sulfonate/bicarbonate transport system permease component